MSTLTGSGRARGLPGLAPEIVPDPPQENRASRTSTQALLELLLSGAPSSRSALATALGISRARLTELSRELIEEGLISERADALQPRKGKGRPFVNLSLNAGYGFCLGASVTDSRVHLVLTDLRGEVQAEQTLPASDRPEGLATAVEEGLSALLLETGLPRKRVLGIGLAISGFVDRGRGLCLHSANLGWYDVPLAALVTGATGLPTVLENDANAAASSEKLFGVARDARNFALVTLGASIGGAHYVGGQLYRGSHGGAGEIAHVTAELGGLPCLCGKRGCLDTIASKTALLQLAGQAGLEVTSVGDLERLAVYGDARALQILKRGGQALGLVIATLVQSNDPDLVLIADSSGFEHGLFLTEVRHTIENNILPRFLRTTRIEIHSVQDGFWARGAASMATQAWLSSFVSA